MNGFTRRRFLQNAAALGLLAGVEHLLPAYAWPNRMNSSSVSDQTAPPVIDLSIQKQTLDIGGRAAAAITINGSLPGPLIRLQEGRTVTLNVTNRLDEDTSIHWHGILLPANMDGVPGVSFAGIKPGQTFRYRYPVAQSGTYWYHSHSGLQEQWGVYGPLIIDPQEPAPITADRDYVVLLSDWTFEDPYRVAAKLKKQSDYYNFQKQTAQDFIHQIAEHGWWPTIGNRLAWGRMRMDPTDIADVTGSTYTYLLNGLAPGANWTGLFRPGERIRLRFINSAAMTYFDIRIPGLKMTIVQADGQNLQPVTVDEFRIAVAETYDVIVEPQEDRAYTLFAESMDRSGYARGTLAPRQGMTAPLPERRSRPLLTMADMGMAGMHEGHEMPNVAHVMTHGTTHNMHQHGASTDKAAPAGSGVAVHGPDQHGPGNSMVALMSSSRLDEPGSGLDSTGTRVLAYSDLRGLVPGPDQRAPERELELHLTGNMERYMWSFDGKKFSEVKGPIPFYYGERLRLILVNDTMMNHPIHLHGMWMELDNGAGRYKPKKHTVNVKPAERLSVEITADALGQWAFHCHLVYHMEAGMFRIVAVGQQHTEGRR